MKILSCIQPTAEMHIGNYFGAVANWVALQAEHECIYGIVDLHAMSMPYDPVQLRANTDRMLVELLACGIDPDRTILFVQSLVPEHAELFWILGCCTAFGELRRMTQFKDKSEAIQNSGSENYVSVGLFAYPVLQAADILIYRADAVPVGKDQEQHLELSRVIARRFNSQFGAEFFPEPAALFTETAKVMSLADPTKKMSKSLGPKHFVGLFEDEASIREKVKSAVTDSGVSPDSEKMSPGVANLFEILKACGKHSEFSSLLGDFHNGALKYSLLKTSVSDSLVELTAGLRRRRSEIAQDTEWVVRKGREMSERAREQARGTLDSVRAIVGLPTQHHV